ncbi:STAS domain-containing protein [Umezawaea sp. Da 62-37]|uniref:STAS domain-containing protein n=1 Tax=Umezawaea sp. Da 62-37 TaxID=3075927 RepID=UPI0028F72C88|nr:STAS domain-containing protein [Umezawaea sp. Da 62-37]WNV87280.1 STAS domain-containing protein [Umezawaea sp. Da 62-37]
MTGLSWVVEHTGGRAVVAVGGALDVTTSAGLEAVLLALAAESDVLIDLRALEFADSSGLSAFVAAYKCGLRHGRTVTLDPVPPFLVRVLGVTGLDAVLLAGG